VKVKQAVTEPDNEDDEAVVEDEESEFNHFEDEEEFEGYYENIIFHLTKNFNLIFTFKKISPRERG